MASTLISRLRTPIDSKGNRRDIHLKTVANAVHYGTSTKKLNVVLDELDAADAQVESTLNTTESDCNTLINNEKTARRDGDNAIKNDIVAPLNSNVTDINKILNTMVEFDEEEQPETDHKVLWVKKDTLDPGQHPHEPWEPGDYEPDPDLPPYEIDPGPTVGPRERIFGFMLSGEDIIQFLFLSKMNIDNYEQIYEADIPLRRYVDFNINPEYTVITGKEPYEDEKYPLKVLTPEEMIDMFGDIDRGNVELVGAVITEHGIDWSRQYVDFRAVDKETGEIIPDYPIPYNSHDIVYAWGSPWVSPEIMCIVNPDYQYCYIFFPIKFHIEIVRE